MQSAAPEAVDLTQRKSTPPRQLYGMDEPETKVYGSELPAGAAIGRARRALRRSLFSGSGSGWDAHHDVEANHSKWCKASDKPVAGLLADLKARGMLKDTLVVWGGEFGRTPFARSHPPDRRPDKYGRDHNPWGFTMWMAGGGVKGGQTIGSTDDIGLRAAGEPTHVWDIHASILNLLGLDHLRTTYMHNGRAERPTVTGGNLITKLWA